MLESLDFSSLACACLVKFQLVYLSLPRETFGSATGTIPMIKSLYKASSGTMINYKHIMTCCKKMTPSASLQHRSGRYNHPTVNQ